MPSLPQSQGLLSDYLTTKQLASELGVGPYTVLLWERLGKAPPRIMVGRRPFYPREKVIAWLQAGGMKVQKRKTA